MSETETTRDDRPSDASGQSDPARPAGASTPFGEKTEPTRATTAGAGLRRPDGEAAEGATIDPTLLVTIESHTDASTSATAPGVTIEASDEAVRNPAPGVIIEPSDASARVGAPSSRSRRRLGSVRRVTPLGGRATKWDRPAQPHDWRWYVGSLGRTLIAVGLLMFGFVAYQLWGTGIETARAQNALENDFEELLAAAPPTGSDDPLLAVERRPEEALPDPGPDALTEPEDDTAALVPDSTVAAVPDDAASAPIPVERQNIPEPENGDALARIEIPRIGVDDIVVAGVGTGDLKKGPGHFPDTPLPGQLGNSAIAGHRTTYGAPFSDVDQLAPGDEIRMTTLTGVYVYRVTGQQIVAPSDYQVVATTDPTIANLTLTSCHPKLSASQRIVISSELDRTESSAVGEPTLNYGRDDAPADVAAPADDPAEAVEATLPTEDVPTEPVDAGGPDPAVDVVRDDAASDPAPDLSIDGDVADSNVRADPPSFRAEETTEGIADAFSDGWFSDPAAPPHVGFWGLAVAIIGLGAYLLSRRTRRDWIGGLVGLVPFVVALYFFFQNVNRLLPPNL